MIINETQITEITFLRIIILIGSYLPSFFVTFITFPLCLSPFCILSCVENKSNLATVKLMKKHQHHEKEHQKHIEDEEEATKKDSDLFSSSSDSDVEVFGDEDHHK